MANLVNHLRKGLRCYVPMIRFRYGLNQIGASSSTHILNENKNESNSIKNIDTSSSSSTTIDHVKSIEKSSSLEFSQTPTKYRRRPLTQDEIDLVTVGGFT